MSSASNAKLMAEVAQQVSAGFVALTDSGDHKTFTSAASQWSGADGFEPSVRPNGIITGGAVTGNGVNDQVSVEALTCYLAGVETSVAGDSAVALTRPAADKFNVCSVQITSAGAISVVVGTDGDAFSATRGAAGGPPYILVGSIEIAQVKLDAHASAAISASEIFQVPNSSAEYYDYPLWDPIAIYAAGGVTLLDALPASHTGDVTKKVYASYATPIFSEIQLSAAFKPPEESYSVSSEQVYGSTVGSSSKSLGQGSFTAKAKDGITDILVKLKNKKLWFKFFPNRLAAPYILTQGYLGIARDYPASGSIGITCTINAEAPVTEKAA